MTVVQLAQSRLTTNDWLTTLEPIVHAAAGPRGQRLTEVTIDMRQIRWLGQMPLLAICLGIQHLAHEYVDQLRLTLPREDRVRAFLQRWEFQQVTHAHSVEVEGEPVLYPYGEAARLTRVLPIRSFHSLDRVVELRDFFRRAGTESRTILENTTYLKERDIRGFADLIIFELCKNAIEHRDSSGAAFIFGRASPANDPARERNPAEWEKPFLEAIGEEGMTEIVLGDGGVGVIDSLRHAHSDQSAASDPAAILQWAFEPFSTRKRQRAEHTRGLWAVKQKVRQLRGLLYVRTGYTTASGERAGISASWDFLNEPARESPGTIQLDTVPFGGTQYQIVLPHHAPGNVNTRVAWHRTPAMKLPKLVPDVYQLPPAPPAKALHRKLLDVRENHVLFIDMSLVEENEWGHKLDELAKEIAGQRAAGRALRVWLLNPSKYVVEQLRVSTFFVDLWRYHGLVQPFVTLVNPDKEVPHVEFLVSDAALELEQSVRDDGDTLRSRMLLIQMLSRAVQGVEIDTDALGELDADERQWLDLALDRNNGILAGVAPDAKGNLTPAFDVEKLAFEAVTLLAPQTLMTEVKLLLEDQKAAPCIFQLPSKASPTFCTAYVPPTVLKMIPPATLAAVNEWIERQIRESGARHAISFSIFARDMLATAVRADRTMELIALQHYMPELKQIDAIPAGSHAVLLALISGAARTLEHIARRLHERGVKTTVISVIDTVTDQDREQLPTLTMIDAQGRWRYLVPLPIKKYPTLEAVPGADVLPISVVDPETLLPVAPVSATQDKLTDGEFWRMVVAAQALSNEPVTYKGIDYTNLIWVKNLFDHAECVKKVHEDFASIFSDRETTQDPDIICVTKETYEAVHDTRFWNETVKKFRNTKVIHEGELDDTVTKNLEGMHVVIFAAASSSGGGVGRLIKRLQTARRLHLSIFINRVPEAILTSFVRLQQPRMSVTSFRRLYAHSPEGGFGSSRSVSLRYLNEYRTSCLSNRLLLFVQESQRRYERPLAAQTPDELATILKPLQPPLRRTMFRADATYDLGSRKGREDLEQLVRGCDKSHEPWVSAILEEAAAREEASGRHDLYPVIELYRAANDLAIRQAILQTLVLDRWHGRSQIESQGANEFGDLILADFRSSQNVEFRCVCIRSVSKLNRRLLFDALDEIIRISMADRTIELTVGLELSKLIDEPQAADSVIGRLTDILESRRNAERVTEFDVSLRNLTDDIGLELVDNQLLLGSWPKVSRVLYSEPPDEERTVRFLIRLMRRVFGRDARILFYRVISDDRYHYGDAWPPRRSPMLAPVPEGNILAQQLVLMNRPSFYSPWLKKDKSAEVRRFLATLRETKPEDANEVENLGMVLYQLELGDETTGVLRIFLPPTDEPEEMQRAVKEVLRAVQIAKGLIRRSKSDLPKIGEWQYLRMFERSRKTDPWRADEGVIPGFAEQLQSLLGADLVTLFALDKKNDVWTRKPLPNVWTPAKDGVTYRVGDEKSMTANAARSRRIIRFDDAQDEAKKERVRPPVDWVHGCVSLPLTYQERECRYVINLWHHVRGWFSQYSEGLLMNLTAIGGFYVEIVTRYQDERLARGEVFKTLASEKAVERIADMLLMCELLTTNAIENGSDGKLLLPRTRDALRTLRGSFEELLHMTVPAGSEDDEILIGDLVHEVAREMVTKYGDVEYDIRLAKDVPRTVVDVPVIRRVIAELLKNARTHLQPSSNATSTVLVHIAKEEDPQSVTIEVTNKGYGIHPSRKLAIFDGPGVGLALARLAAERHGGRLEEVGKFKHRASFRLTLPVRSLGGSPGS